MFTLHVFLLEHLNFGCAYFSEDFQPQLFLLTFLIEIQTKKNKKKLFDKSPRPFHLKKRLITTYDVFETKGFMTHYFRHFFIRGVNRLMSEVALNIWTIILSLIYFSQSRSGSVLTMFLDLDQISAWMFL